MPYLRRTRSWPLLSREKLTSESQQLQSYHVTQVLVKHFKKPRKLWRRSSPSIFSKCPMTLGTIKQLNEISSELDETELGIAMAMLMNDKDKQLIFCYVVSARVDWIKSLVKEGMEEGIQRLIDSSLLDPNED